MQEIWKDIKGYEGKYKISNYGEVISLPRLKNNHSKLQEVPMKRITPYIDKNNGYVYVHLCNNGKCKNIRLHRLVAETFIQNPNNLPQVNHKDENKQNNNVTNLEFCDSKYNMQYSFAKKVNQYDSNGNFIRTWDCIMDIERELGINNSNISKCCKGIRNKAGGFLWKTLN